MKLIHLSDLHIGKRVNEVSMINDQEFILNQILSIVDVEKPDAVMICGDVYDKSVPSAEAVTVLDNFMWSLSRRPLKTLIISGNHDSPERLSFAHRLIKDSGIYVSPVYNGNIEPILLEDSFGTVSFWMLPFIKPAHVKRFFPEASIESYTDACRVAVEHMGADFTKRNVLLTHQFVTGANRCESENISVGGSDNVDGAVFSEFDYVALGHIHGPQNIVPDKIRYCGTPLKYSFSEKDHNKSVTIVEMGEKGSVKIRTCALSPKHDLREIRGSYDELTAKSFYDGTRVDDYLHIILTDEEDVPEAMGRLRVIYKNVMKLSYDNTRTRTKSDVEGSVDIQRKSPLDLFCELYEQQNNKPMSETQLQYAARLIESIWEAGK